MRHTREGELLHVCIAQFSCMNGKGHIGVGHVTRSNAKCPTPKRECHTLELDTTHTQMRRVTHVNEKCHPHEWNVLHTRMWKGTRHTSMPQLRKGHFPNEWHVTNTKGTCPIWITRHRYERDMSHIRQGHVSSHTWRRYMPHIWMRHATLMKKSCHAYGMPHTYEGVLQHIRRSHVAQFDEQCHTYEWVISHVWMQHVTHMQHIYCRMMGCKDENIGMGWPQLVGSLKI